MNLKIEKLLCILYHPKFLVQDASIWEAYCTWTKIRFLTMYEVAFTSYIVKNLGENYLKIVFFPAN